jgi:tetratricopeptide (TPR) repeat protein
VPSTGQDHRRLWPTGALLGALLALWPTVRNGWVNWDDPYMVRDNPLVQSLSIRSVREMFATPEVFANYNPLTLLSWAVDHAIGGVDPTVYHTTNLVLHLANVLCVFWFVHRLSGRADVAGMTAVLFGVHPMQVEAVAWITARKDVLCAFFYLLGLVAWLSYVRSDRGGHGAYALTLVAFLLAVLSKGVAVTFPLALLVVDYAERRTALGRIVVEKLPFVVLAAVFAVVAVAAQQRGGAMGALGETTLLESVRVAAYGLSTYAVKALVPFRLSVFHPYPVRPGHPLPWYFAASIVLVVAVGLAVLRHLRCRHAWTIGVMLFAVMLAPTLQVLPFGSAVIAERYTYLPYVGLFFVMASAFASAIDGTAPRWAPVRRALPIVGAAWVAVLGVMAFQRTAVWSNGAALWTDVIEKYPDHYFGYGSRAAYYQGIGDFRNALRDYARCLELNPRSMEALTNRAAIHVAVGDVASAVRDYDRALEIDPSYGAGYTNRGLMLLQTNRVDEALRDFERAVEMAPDVAFNHYYLGVARSMKGAIPDAIASLQTAIARDPRQAVFYKSLGEAQVAAQQLAEAARSFDRALEIAPTYAEVYYLQSVVHHRLQRDDVALGDALRAQALRYPVDPRWIETLRK